MASPVPAKSQPLHNFSLPHLKWKKNHTNNHHRGRRIAESPPPQQQQQRSPPSDAPHLPPPPPPPPLVSATQQSPILDSVSDNRRNSPEGAKADFSTVDNLGKKAVPSDVDGDGGNKDRKSKIYIRFGKRKAEEVPEEGKACTVEGEVEESVSKTWNLRPRRPIHKLSNGNGGIPKVGGSPVQENKAQLPQPELITAEKKEKKQNFSIPLSREEIEEDIYAMTGSKPSRRPKKRAKAVRKQLDNLFPGLWLALITPESYKVSDLSAKG